MNKLMGTLVLGALMLLGGSAAHAQVAVGIRIGPPPPARVVVVPASPGPDFVWVEGYWYPIDGHYRWHRGYWTRPPYPGARWVVPRHEGGFYYHGYWDGDHGRFEHRHGWDRDHDRDHDRWRDHDHDRDHDRH